MFETLSDYKVGVTVESLYIGIRGYCCCLDEVLKALDGVNCLGHTSQWAAVKQLMGNRVLNGTNEAFDVNGVEREPRGYGYGARWS